MIETLPHSRRNLQVLMIQSTKLSYKKGFPFISSFLLSFSSSHSHILTFSPSSLSYPLVRFISCCKDLIILSPQVSAMKNIDNVLWKYSFYRTIESYRKQIRQISTILEKPTIRSSSIDLKHQELRQNLLKFSTTLNQYLSQAAAFYEGFLMQLETILDKKSKEKELLTDPTLQLNTSQDIDGYLKSIYFCLLFLGDIARYTELHNLSNKPKNWNVASQYYFRARQVLPNLGNSHNQV